MSDSRAKKSGLGADIEKKLERRFDEEEAAGTTNAIILWINAVIGPDHENIASCSQKDMHRAMANGVLLCKLINKLLAHDAKAPVSFQKRADSPFVAMGNIQSYNKGCLDFGLGQEFQFQSTDLWEGRKGPLMNVINGLHKLGGTANNKQYPVTYTGESIKYLDNE